MLLFSILVLELLLLGYVISSFLRERQALRRFVGAASEPDRLKELAMQLPAAYRAPATQFAGELVRKGSLDELIVQGITQAANTTFGFSLSVRLVIGVVLSLIALLPLAASLFAAATQIGESLQAVQGLSGSRAFLGSKPLLEPAFADLHSAAQGTAWICAGMVIIATVHWLLNRSEVREARFIEALLEAAISARPGTPAPVASRLSELVAPERGLAMPIVAFVFFFVAAGAGWLLLFLTANVKEANAADVYSVWPPGSRPDITPKVTMQIPVSRRGGGSPIPKDGVASLSILEDALDIAGAEIDRDDKTGRFKAAELQAVLARFKNAELAILADRRTEFKHVYEVLELLQSLDVKRVYLVIERTVLVKGVSGGDRIFAGIPFRLARSDLAEAFTLRIDGSTVWVDPGMPKAEQVDTHRAAWTTMLNDIARKRIAERSGSIGQPQVAVEIKADGLTYDKMLEILSTADTTCERDADCGVPGLGLQFFWKP